MDWRISIGLRGITAIVLCFSGSASAVDDPWADTIIEANINDPFMGFGDPQEALGAPLGGGVHVPSNSSIVSIGSAGSYIILGFDTPILDDPANPDGIDFIIFSNAFWNAGNPQNKFVEPALIEISEDVNGNGLADDPWYVIPGSRGYAQSTVPAGITNPSPILAGNVINPNSTDGDTENNDVEYDWGYAELTPTRKPYADNYLRPDDPYTVGLSEDSGGGDAFDIAWAMDGSAIAANLNQIHFIRIWSFIDASLGGLGTVSPEINAVADVDPLTDTDNDGITDAYEIRVAGTDPNHPASTIIPLETEFPVAEEVLGTVHLQDVLETTFISTGLRNGFRDYNMTVTLGVGTDTGDPVPGKTKSDVICTLDASVSDFTAAQIAPAEVVIHYSSLMIEGLNEEQLAPWRHDGSGYTQDGIDNVTVDIFANEVAFTTQYSGTFILASSAGLGDQATELPGPTPLWGLLALGLASIWRLRRHG